MTKPLHIFRAGRHTAMSGATLDFTEADLLASAKAYDPALHEAPIVIGHPAADAPAYGWVAGLAAHGADLEAVPHQVRPEFAEAVKRGDYKKISPSFYPPGHPSNPVPGVFYLRHVGFLGAQPPALKGLRPAEFADEADGLVTIEFSDPDDRIVAGLFRQFREWLIGKFGQDEADKALPSGAVASLEFLAAQPDEPDEDDAPGPMPAASYAEALSSSAWSGISASDYASAEAYCSACLVDQNEPGKPKSKGACHLPVREPGGKLNRSALFAAQGALVGARGGVDLPAAAKKAAARKLAALMKEHKLQPAGSLAQLANFSETEEAMTPEQIAAREAELNQQAEALVAREASFAEREQGLTAQENEARRKGLVEFSEVLVAAGRILPRHQDALVEIMSALGVQVVEFGEGDDKVNKPAIELLQDFLQELPAQVEYGEHAAAGNEAPAPITDPNELARKAQDYQEAERQAGRVVTITQAVQAVQKSGGK